MFGIQSFFHNILSAGRASLNGLIEENPVGRELTVEPSRPDRLKMTRASPPFWAMLCIWEMMACHSLWRMTAPQILQASMGPFFVHRGTLSGVLDWMRRFRLNLWLRFPKLPILETHCSPLNGGMTKKGLTTKFGVA